MQQRSDHLESAGFGADAHEQVEAIVEHLNAAHADTVLFVARHLEPAGCGAELVAVDPGGAVMAVRRPDGTTERVRLDFASVAVEARDVHAHLLAAVEAARSGADPAVPLTSLERELRATAALRTTHGSVQRVQRLTPSLLEVAVGGLSGLALVGGDEFVYVMVSDEPGGISPGYDMSDHREQSVGGPVRGAYYTVRRSRPEVGEVDLWVVEHDHPRSVAAWMRGAEPGAPLAFWGPRRGFEIPEGAGDVLLVADETGLAAVAALVESAAAELRIVAVLESAGVGDRPPMPSHPGLRTVWVDRGGGAPGTGDHLLAAVRHEVAVAPGAAFGAAESRQISAVRRYLRSEVGVAATAVSMTGYWRRHG